MIVFPIIFLMIFLAEPVIHILLSDKYLPALPILRILPLFALLEVLSKPFQSQLQGMNRPNVIRDRMIIMVTINIILNFILIPRDIQSLGIRLAGLGPIGASISTVIAYFVGFIATRVYAFHILDVKGNYRIIFHAISATIMGIILYIISQNYYIDRWFQLIFICLIGLGMYILILIAFKEFGKEDFHFFIDTIHPIKMLRYIFDEIKGTK
jgi:O-antigen/teichoic acid export membrane protein